jgi:hypothetical protein
MQRPLSRLSSISSSDMISILPLLLGLLLFRCWLAPFPALAANAHSGSKIYLGFDRNEYPGDDLLSALRQNFSYAGYWLNPPPEAVSNSWVGKRTVLREQGFGFLVLFNGRLDAQLKGQDAAALGRKDAQAAIAAARREGFPAGTLIFLDQEEGGRLLPEQSSYLFAWIDAIRESPYRAGVYCSGIEVPDGTNRISTAEDIRSHANGRPIKLWVTQDTCPPAPGCAIPRPLPAPSGSGVEDALVWQYTRSPRQPEFTRQCARTYAADGNCYAPGIPPNSRSFVDLNVSESADPSSGR